MDKFLNKGVKEVIVQFPEVGVVLNDFGVGCVNCSVGTCLLKDIIGIHNLDGDAEVELMARIEKTIYPERDVILKPRNQNSSKKSPLTLEYSVPVKQLVDEHMQIKRLPANIPKICEMIKNSSQIDFKLILDCVEFIKNYADKFHHSKEEDILFKYTDENSDIIKSMLEEHKLARWFVKSILRGIEKQNPDTIIENLTNYGELLMQHIKKEDEILYPFIDRNITAEEVRELNDKFNNVNSEVENGFNERWEGFLNKVEGLGK